MSAILARTYLVARKVHECNACHFVRQFLGEDWYSAEEEAQIAAAGAQKWEIVPGQKYLRVVYVDGGDLHVFRAIPEIDAICQRHEMYPEE